MIPAIPFFFLRRFHPRVHHAISAELLCITVQDLLIFSGLRHSDTEFFMGDGIKIADKEKYLIFFFAVSGKYDQIFLIISAVDPLKALRLIV